MDDEIWLAKLFNDHLPGVGNAFLKLAGMPAEPRPWAGFIVMQILVALILILLFAFLRPRLSMDRPGKLQHTFELIHDFVGGESESAMGHAGLKYLPFFGTLFLFILFCNLIGIVPGFEAPTMTPSVPAGCAVAGLVFFSFFFLFFFFLFVLHRGGLRPGFRPPPHAPGGAGGLRDCGILLLQPD